VPLWGIPVKQDGKKVNRIQKKIQQGHNKLNRKAKKPTGRHKNGTGRQKRLQEKCPFLEKVTSNHVGFDPKPNVVSIKTTCDSNQNHMWFSPVSSVVKK
jgi:hypothetical protein